MAGANSTLDPAILDRLSGLSLVARTVVEGFTGGHHVSPHRGSSIEFAQHRPYSSGDELRKIDWKVFARSDRLVVKEYIEETNLSCNILLDASESMGYTSLPWTKLDYARWCAAALSHLILIQRDTAGLVIFDEKDRVKVPPGNGAPQEAAIIGALEEAEAKGPTNIGKCLEWIASRLKRRGIIAIFSDFFDEPEAILAGVKRLVYGGHEPILFHVLDPQEIRFEFDALVKLQGLEGVGDVKIDPKSIRDAYLEEIGRHNRVLARQARALSVDYVLLDTSRSLDAVLSAYLARRTARARGGRR